MSMAPLGGKSYPEDPPSLFELRRDEPSTSATEDTSRQASGPSVILDTLLSGCSYETLNGGYLPMKKVYNVFKPKEGLNTLVSQFSFLQLEKVIVDVQKRRAQGATERDLRNHIDSRYAEFDELSREKIYQLSLGLTPDDDIQAGDVSEESQLDRTALKVVLKEEDSRLHEGSIVYYHQKRWVVVEIQGAILVLKSF